MTQGGGVAPRRTHNPEIAGSSPAPATTDEPYTPPAWEDEAGNLKPGIYPGVDFDTYARWRAANHSILKHFAATAAHAHWNELHQDDSTSSQNLGHMIHTALLEPERWKAEGALVAPKIDRRTKIGKAEWAMFEKRAAGRPLVTEEDAATIGGILHMSARHASVKEALYGAGLNELSIIWKDPATGVLCKARIDRLTQIGARPFIVDLKTTHKVASTHGWQQQVQTYSLHEQAAHYRAGLATLMPLAGELERGFAWVVCETEPPWLVRMFEAEDACLELGKEQVDGYLKRYAQCKATGVWPGWPEGMEIAGLPPWVYKRFNVE